MKAIYGFSIVEAIVSMVLMSIFISGLLLTWMNLSYQKNEIYHHKAIVFAEQISDSIRTYQLTESFSQKQNNLNVRVSINQGSNNISFTVSVFWKKSRTIDQQVALTGSYRKKREIEKESYSFVR